MTGNAYRAEAIDARVWATAVLAIIIMTLPVSSHRRCAHAAWMR